MDGLSNQLAEGLPKPQKTPRKTRGVGSPGQGSMPIRGASQ